MEGMNRLALMNAKRLRFEVNMQSEATSTQTTKLYWSYSEAVEEKQRRYAVEFEADINKEARRGRVTDSFLTCASQVGHVRPLPFYSHGTVTAPISSHGRNYFRRQITNPAGSTHSTLITTGCQRVSYGT